jgi:cephalosporin hydroxylase
MWLIGLALALSLFGLVLAIRAMLLVIAERTTAPPAPAFSLHGLGLGCILVGGLTLVAAGQYQVLEVMLQPPEVFDAPDFHPLRKIGVICGAALTLIGMLLERVRPSTVNARATGGAPRGVVTFMMLLVVALVGFNVYQYATNAKATDEINRYSEAGYRPPMLRTAAAPVMGDDQIVRAYTRLFHDQVFAKSENTPQWMGIPTQQNPNDAWLVQELIHAVKPDFIVETGTFHGGSALMWAMILREVNPKGRVLTVDIEDVSVEARKQDIWKERIDFFLGSSTDPKIVADIANRVKGGRVLVILDALHTADHVHRELQMYSPLVDVGSYIMVQDTLGDYPPAFLPQNGPGPWTGLQQFLRETDAFVIDGSRERFLFTFNPKSMLKRVK